MQKEMIDGLNGLMECNGKLIDLYSTAIRTLVAEEVRQRFRSYRSDHERQLNLIAKSLEDLGVASPKAASRIAQRVGGQGRDRLELLRQIEKEEDRLFKLYEETKNRWEEAPAWSSRLSELMGECIEDERRHSDYVHRVLKDETWRSDHYRSAS